MEFFRLDDSDIKQVCPAITVFTADTTDDSMFFAQALQPNLILSVEVDELHINAGLQDRVVQVCTFGSLATWDATNYRPICRCMAELFAWTFQKRQWKRTEVCGEKTLTFHPRSKSPVLIHCGICDSSLASSSLAGHGDYERLPLDYDALPPLWLAFVADPSDSGRMHSNIRQVWRGVIVFANFICSQSSAYWSVLVCVLTAMARQRQRGGGWDEKVCRVRHRDAISFQSNCREFILLRSTMLSYTLQGKEALLSNDYGTFMELMYVPLLC